MTLIRAVLELLLIANARSVALYDASILSDVSVAVRISGQPVL